MKSNGRILLGVSLLALAAGMAGAQQATELDAIVIQNAEETADAGAVSLTAQDLERLQPSTLSDVFRRESGIAVGGGSAASQRVHVNGLEESKLSVTVDGARQPGNFWHHSGTSQIDPAFLKSVQVRPGVASADAGFATGAGALRYETLDAADLLSDGQDFGARVSLGFGANGYGAKGTIAAYGRGGAWDWLAMLGKHEGDAYENGDGAEQGGTAPALASGLFKLGYTSQEGHRLELSVDHSRDDAIRPLRMNMDTVGGALPLNRNDMRRTTTVLRYSTVVPSAGWDPVAELWFNDFALHRPDNGYARPSGAFNLESESFGGKFQNSFTFGSGQITAGIDFMSADTDLERFAYPTLPAGMVRESTRQTGVFVQGDFDLGRGFGLSAGIRADKQRFDAMDGQSFDNSGLSANATLTYEVADGVQVFASAGRSWMGLEQGEMALFHARDYIYDPDVKAAWAANYRLGLSLEHGPWEGAVTVFDTTLHNPVAYDFTTVPTRLGGPDLRSRGAELSLAYGWDTGRAGVKISHADVTFDSATVLPGATDAAPMGTTVSLFADHRIDQLDLTVGASVEHALKLDDVALLAGGYLAQPDYTVIDLYGEWTPVGMNGLSLRLAIDNLLDETYVARGTYPDFPGRAIDAVEAPGRTVSLTANYRF